MEHTISTLEIIPSRGGVFEVEVDGKLVYSKKETGRHAKPGEIMGLIRSQTS